MDVITIDQCHGQSNWLYNILSIGFSGFLVTFILWILTYHIMRLASYNLIYFKLKHNLPIIIKNTYNTIKPDANIQVDDKVRKLIYIDVELCKNLSRSEIEALISQPLSFAGNALTQCQALLAKISPLLARWPKAASYKARPIR